MKLNEYLKNNSITQDDFAKTISIKQSTIANYIAERRIPKPEIIKKIHDVTNGFVTYNDWYTTAEIPTSASMTIPPNNFNIREAIMQHFGVNSNFLLQTITNTYNNPPFPINCNVVIDTTITKINTGYFLIQIDAEQEAEIYKATRVENKIMLSNSFTTLEYKNNYTIIGKAVGKVIFELI